MENNKDPYENIRKRIEYAEAQIDRAGEHGFMDNERLMAAQAVATIAQVEMLMILDSTLDRLANAYGMVHFG